MLTYNYLQNWSGKNNFPLKRIAEELDFTLPGLRRAIENQSLPMSKVLPLCKIIGISPNNFFGVSESPTSYNNTLCQIGTAVNSPTAIETLRNEINEKNEQIKQLLNIITKLQQ